MLEELPRKLRSGDEPFHVDDQLLPVKLLNFWQWSVSDLVSNLTRGRLAEFIVALGLGIDIGNPRNEWDAFDLTTASGVKVEVKSAAHVQSWRQKRLSRIAFLTRRTRAWDSATNVQSKESRHQADVYVLALLHHEDKPTIDPLNLAQWSFFVLPTRTLEERKRSQHSITLKSLKALCANGSGAVVSHEGLKAAVEKASQA